MKISDQEQNDPLKIITATAEQALISAETETSIKEQKEPSEDLDLARKETEALAETDKTNTERQLNQIRESLFADSITENEYILLAQDPETKSLYQDIFEGSNFDTLREKSANQATELSERYFGRYSLFSFRERHQKKAKLELFERFVETLAPVRADKNEYSEYQSPERTGNAASYGPQDILVHSEKFVYASFTEIGHSMSQGPDQHRLDKNDIAPRAQIVMNDIANVVARTAPGESFVKKYLKNIFDFENGKKILAIYLASVFETPQQAVDMLSSTGGRPEAAQRWDSMPVFNYKDSTMEPKNIEEFNTQNKHNNEMAQIFLQRMKLILEETGIEPPLSIEVRVKDSAKIEKKY